MASNFTEPLFIELCRLRLNCLLILWVSGERTRESSEKGNSESSEALFWPDAAEVVRRSLLSKRYSASVTGANTVPQHNRLKDTK